MYMNFHIIPAPTKEIAIGRKIRLLAADSNLIRSAKTAANRPKPVEKLVTTITHHRLFITVPRRVDRTAKIRRKIPIAVGVSEVALGCIIRPLFLPSITPANEPIAKSIKAIMKRRLVKMLDQSLKSILESFVSISP